MGLGRKIVRTGDEPHRYYTAHVQSPYYGSKTIVAHRRAEPTVLKQLSPLRRKIVD